MIYQPIRIEKTWGYDKRNFTALKQGDCVYIEKGFPHKLIALDDNATIIEVSTQHFDSDSYRIYRNTWNDLEG